MPSRSSAPWRARCSTASTPAARACSRPRASAAARKSISSSGKSSVASTSRRSSTSASRERVDLARERAVERARRRARRRFGAGVDQVGDGFGLREVELVVEEGALGELAGLGDAQVRQSRAAGRRVGSAPASRQRASSSCSTTGPPCACSSSTSSPVYECGAGKWSARPRSIGVARRRRGTARRSPGAATSARPQTAAISGASDAPETRTMPTAPRPLAVATATIGSSWRASGSIGTLRRRGERCATCRARPAAC